MVLGAGGMGIQGGNALDFARFDTFSRFWVGLSVPAPPEGKPFDFRPSNVFSMSIADLLVR